ncbi:MAG: RimK family alpha-L-glutamate ligase [Desulfobacteraceae bacterium]|nr:RimK family alpha-L-glutamate ligase [Desulfobacteraceae bacterium]
MRNGNGNEEGRDIISLGRRLRKSSIRCVGIRPNWEDYPEDIRRAVASAKTVCYPGPVYEHVFEASGVEVFPRSYYPFLGNKIAQTNLFQLLGISHPRTGIYYGRNPALRRRIERDFAYPLVGKTPVGSSRGEGVYLIGCAEELSTYLNGHNPAYIQEYLPIERDLRVVIIGAKVVHAYWRLHREGDFRNNVAQGGAISFDPIPAPALDFALDVASRCDFGEVGLDICESGGVFYVLEANMVFGLEGFRKKGLDIYRIIADLFDNGETG